MATTKWSLDPTHSELGFKIRHLMITNVSGFFKNIQAQAETDSEDFSTVKVKLTVEMDSISTNNEERDKHLRNADFFEVERFPQMIFESTRIEKEDEELFVLIGNLTLKGITKPVKLNVEYSGITRDPWGGERAGFTVDGKIKRSDWGVSFNTVLETGGVALGDEIKVHGEIQLVKQLVPSLV